jgi:serine/threonine protein kinase
MGGNDETIGPHAPGPPETVRDPLPADDVIHDLGEQPVEIQPGSGPPREGVASYREFARALIEIGITDEAELESFGTDSTEGVLGLSRRMVKAGKLTPYQAAAVYQKKTRGLLIGDYLILDKIGQGGMGLVFKARHRKLGRVGALKILPPSFARDKAAVLRFRREFEAAGQLKHLNLVAAFEANEDRGVHFLVMDFVDGVNLDKTVREQGPLAVAVAVDYAIQAARGLEAAHEKGIIHRDIKPGNLMLDRAGTVRVLDLGLARFVDASNPFSKNPAGRLTQSGMYMGTIDYMAPEQAEDSHNVDHRADIYSLGCTFFFLLTAREPFAGGTILKRMVAHQEHAAPSLRTARPDVPPELEAVYLKMMAKKPEERPATMSELISLLQAAKHAINSDLENIAMPQPSRAEREAPRGAAVNRGASPKIVVDSAIFARGARGQAPLDHELNLRDLVMDVRSEAAAPARGTEPEISDGLIDQPTNFRDLLSDLREEALAPFAHKPTPAAEPPSKRSAPPPPPAPAPRPSTPPPQPAPLPRTAAGPPPPSSPLPPANPTPARPPARRRDASPAESPTSSSPQIQQLAASPAPANEPRALSTSTLVKIGLAALVLVLLVIALFAVNNSSSTIPNDDGPTPASTSESDAATAEPTSSDAPP